jgi:hypothetical protein
MQSRVEGERQIHSRVEGERQIQSRVEGERQIQSRELKERQRQTEKGENTTKRIPSAMFPWSLSTQGGLLFGKMCRCKMFLVFKVRYGLFYVVCQNSVFLLNRFSRTFFRRLSLLMYLGKKNRCNIFRTSWRRCRAARTRWTSSSSPGSSGRSSPSTFPSTTARGLDSE